MKLYCIQVGAFKIPRGFIAMRCENADVPTEMPIFAYLIEHPQGLVLVDLGQHYDLRDAGSILEESDAITHKISELGYSPSDIKYVVMSHLHFDHCGYMCDFPNSTFIVRREELKAAWWPEVYDSGGYIFSTYEKTRGYDYIQLSDDEEYDVFGDGSIVLVDTRGHSRGHQSVIVNLPETGKAVLVCDAAPFREVVERNLLPGTCNNNQQAIRSLEKLRSLENRGHKLIFAHDPENMPERLFPEYFE